MALKEFHCDIDLRGRQYLGGSAGIAGQVFTSNGPNDPPAWRSIYTISSSEPSSPAGGDKWYNLGDGREYTYINDGNSFQWVDVSSGGTGGTGPITIAASAADLLSASSGEISADDPGGDRLVFWDDSSGKLTYLTLGSGLTISGTEITAEGGGGSGGIDPVIAGMIF